MRWRASCTGGAVRSFIPSIVLAALAVTSGCSSSGCSSKSADASAAPAAADQGGSSIPITVATSGSRLRAKVLTGGGVKELVGWHDKDRNEDCTFQPAEDGHIRCLPATLGASPTNAFSDAACKVPVAAAPTCGADAKYGLALRSVGECGQVVGEMRKALDAKSPTYSPSGAAGACVQITTTPPAGQPGVVALGEVVPWTAFVEAVETNVPNDLVTERVLVGTDGARQHIGFRNDKLDGKCSFQLTADGSTRCIPETSVGPVMYGDSECTKPLLVNDFSQNQGGQCAPKTPANNMWLEPPTEQCVGLRAVYSLRSDSGLAGDGNEVFDWQIRGSGSPSMTPSSATCVSAGTISSGDGSHRRAIDANITTSLPAVPRVSTGSGTTRLVSALVWPAGIDTTLVEGWHDTQLDVDCTFSLASDGKMRCLPVVAAATLLFTDDKCKSPSLVAVQTESECIGTKGRFARSVSTTCPPTTSIYTLGEGGRTLATASFSSAPGKCAKVNGTGTAHDATPVDVTQFVEGVASVE